MHSGNPASRVPLRKAESYLVWDDVSVVVVVTGAGTVVCCEVVVVLCVVGALEQPDSNTRAATARQGMISFFISMFFIWFVVLQSHNYASGWSQAMGCNPTNSRPAPETAPRRKVVRRFHRFSPIRSYLRQSASSAEGFFSFVLHEIEVRRLVVADGVHHRRIRAVRDGFEPFGKWRKEFVPHCGTKAREGRASGRERVNSSRVIK